MVELAAHQAWKGIRLARSGSVQAKTSAASEVPSHAVLEMLGSAPISGGLPNCATLVGASSRHVIDDEACGALDRPAAKPGENEALIWVGPAPRELGAP